MVHFEHEWMASETMKTIKTILELLFKALGLHDGTKKLLLVFVILTVLQMPFSVPGLWKMGWGIYLSWKNDVPLNSLASKPAPSPIVDNERILPVLGPTAPKPAHRIH